MTNLLEKELKIVEKYSVQIRDLYEQYHIERMCLSKEMEKELEEIRQKFALEKKEKEPKPWGSILK